MHHSHTHKACNRNAGHIQRNIPSTTKHCPPTHRQQSTKGQNIILQININGIRNKIEDLKTSYTTRNQISSQYKKLNSHGKLKRQKYTTGRTYMEHKQGGGLLSTHVSGRSPIFPLVVHQPASPSIWPAVQSVRWGLSTNPGVTMWFVCWCS